MVCILRGTPRKVFSLSQKVLLLVRPPAWPRLSVWHKLWRHDHVVATEAIAIAAHMNENTVCSVRTVQFASPTGPVGVILVNLDVSNEEKADALVREAADKLKLQRLSSSLRTDTVLVMMTGKLTAELFARRWRELAVEDATLRVIMSEMRRGEVIQAKAAPHSPISASLMPQANSEIREPEMRALRPPQSPACRPDSAPAMAALLVRPMPA